MKSTEADKFKQGFGYEATALPPAGSAERPVTEHLQNDLKRLEKRLLLLGSRVEDAVREATTSLLELRGDLAERVTAGDAAIDQEEVEIEEDCLKILALHQPVAADLRFTAATSSTPSPPLRLRIPICGAGS